MKRWRVAKKLVRSLGRLLAPSGLFEPQNPEADPLASEQPLFATLYDASVRPLFGLTSHGRSPRGRPGSPRPSIPPPRGGLDACAWHKGPLSNPELLLLLPIRPLPDALRQVDIELLEKEKAVQAKLSFLAERTSRHRGRLDCTIDCRCDEAQQISCERVQDAVC
jgi:hypothetical protein